MSSNKQCVNLQSDRRAGAYWERQFCKLAKEEGLMFTPMQIGREGAALAYQGAGWNTFTLPDVTVWTAPGQHHEIKHKEPTRYDSYGLERYRLDALLAFAEETQQDVLYTIHDHNEAGGKHVKENRLRDWFTVSVSQLDGKWSWSGPGNSWVNGVRKQVHMYYWSIELWYLLGDYWHSTETTLGSDMAKLEEVESD